MMLCLAASRAAAEPDPDAFQYTFTVKPNANGKPVCKLHTEKLPPRAQRVDIKVDAPSGANFKLFVGDAEQTLTASGTFQTLKVALDSEKTPKLVARADASVDMAGCAAFDLPKKPPEDVVGNDDVAAADALRKLPVAAEVHPAGTAPELTYLVHLPSGQPAFPSPAKLTEGEAVQVVLMVPLGSARRTVSLQVDGCGDVNTFRTDVATSDDGKHGLREGRSGFALLPVGQYFRCGAGAVTYTLKGETVADGKTTETTISTTKITFRPKYHVAAIALLGWDSGRRTSYGAELRPGNTSAVVVKRKDKIGVTSYVGAVWMIGGVDYENMQWYNYVANVFLAADPASPTHDVVAGFSITPTGGAALSIGMTFHQGQVLEGLVPGDAVSGTAVPSHASWNERGFGGFIGLSVDSRVYDAIIQRFTRK